MAETRKKTVWNFIDKFEGDKVVWMIVLLLMLLSIVCSFSSTSRLLKGGETRLDIVGGQLIIVFIGLAVIVLCYNIKNINFFRALSSTGFLFSVILLAMLDLHIRTPLVRAINLNGAWRILEIGGFQLHVFEFVKVAMVMYLSWAVEKVKKGVYPFLDSFKDNPHLKWLTTKFAKKCIYLYLPFLVILVMVLPGSNSSALFISGIMFLTIVIGGGELKDMSLLAAAGVLLVVLCTGIYFLSGRKAFSRIGTGIERVFSDDTDNEKIVLESPKGSKAYHDALDEIRQPYSAKIAVKQGGLLGKGAGQSRQRYVVPDISEDYMYSFIIEEYGLLGGIFVLILYLSLIARSVIITRNCGNDLFAKCAVAGLCMLITGQAFLHIFVNVDIGPMTGQTLPLISHGNFAFLCFSTAFGILLAISRIAYKRMKREQDTVAPIMEVRDSLDDLEAFESGASEDDVDSIVSNEYDL